MLYRITIYPRKFSAEKYNDEPVTSGWDRPVFEGWLRSYIVLFEAAVARLMEEDEYFDRLAHIGGYLFHRSEGLKTQRIRDKFIQLPPVLMNRLGNWWHKHLDSPVAARAGICSPAMLTDPYRTVYEDGWRKYAGAWESIKDVSFTSSHRSKPIQSEETEWGEFQEWTPSYVTHLDETLTMFLRAVLRGDRTAAEWSADMLQRWVNTLELRASNRSFMLRSPRFVTLEVMSSRWPEVLMQLEIEDAYRRGYGFQGEIRVCPCYVGAGAQAVHVVGPRLSHLTPRWVSSGEPSSRVASQWDHVCPGLQFIQVVRPLLHHLPSLG